MKKSKIIKALTEYKKDLGLKGDKKEIAILIQHVKDDNFKKAGKHMRSLDTFVRGGIPQKVWNEIELSQFKTEKVVVAKLKFKKDQQDGQKEIVIKDGLIATNEFVFPGNATNQEMAIALMSIDADFMNQFFEIELEEPKRRKREEV